MFLLCTNEGEAGPRSNIKLAVDAYFFICFLVTFVVTSTQKNYDYKMFNI